MRLRNMTVGAMLAAVLLAATALTPAAAQEGKVISGGFDVGPGGLPGRFNPLTATAGFTWLSIYFEPLITYNAEMTNLQGDLAESWTVSEDGKTIAFKLVETQWHDGKPFTARDAKFTIELAKNGASGSIFPARLKAIDSVETPDDRTVVLKLSAPDGSLLANMSQLMMLPEHALGSMDVKQLAESTWWSTSPVGTGPFKFKAYAPDQYVELVANENFRGGRPKVDRLINRYFENSATAVAALRSGDIDFTYVESDDAAKLKSDSNFQVIEGSSFVANYIGFNGELPLWKDPRVRQAFMHAIDRATIVEQVFGGAAKVANCGYVVDNLVPGDLVQYQYDPEKARALLEEAGWDEINGDKPITWLTYYNNPLTANVMAAIQAMMAQVGVNLEPRVVDPPTYNGIVNAPKPDFETFPLVYAGIRNGPDPSAINVAFNQAQIPPNGNNFLRIRDAEVSAALDAAMGEAKADAATGKYQDVCRAMNKSLPVATMWEANRYGVASARLENFVWVPAPAGGPFESYPERWEIKK
jgi:peptide/nickel transport system substrate-binding protein